MVSEILSTINGLLAIDGARLSDWDIIASLIFQALLFLASAFFSSSETALFSLSNSDLQQLDLSKNPVADKIRRLLDEPRQLIISILCGNELINIAASINMASILLALYGDPNKATLANILILFPLLLLLGEVTPKTIAISNPIGLTTKVIARPMSLWLKLVAPLRWAVRQVAERVTNLIVGSEISQDNFVLVDEFRSLLEDSTEDGILSSTERTLIENLIKANETSVREVMIPRPLVDFIDGERPLPEIIAFVREHRIERAPVYRGHRDNIIGFLRVEELLALMHRMDDLNQHTLEEILQPAVIVPPTKRINEMFEFFQTNNVRSAAVMNEYGGVDGYITMQVVFKFIFADIAGPEDVPATDFHQTEQGAYEVNGLLALDRFQDLIDVDLGDTRMTTIGGFIFMYLDRLPKLNEAIIVEDLTFTALEIEGNIIRRLRVEHTVAEDEPALEEEIDLEQSIQGVA